MIIKLTFPLPLPLPLPLLLLLLIIPTIHVSVSAGCTCITDNLTQQNTSRSQSQLFQYKFVAVASILVAGGIGVSLPQLGKKVEALNPENDLFFMIKAFAAGVILATGFIHILPEAFAHLTSPCLLKDKPWANFPFSGFVAMMSAIGTLMVDSFATSFYQRRHFNKPKDDQVVISVEGYGIDDEHAGHIHVHAHATDGHAHGSDILSDHESQLIRHRIISQVLELGIVVHSVIIGISLGTSQTLGTIKPLLAALSFHQFFEGMGLGGCISQAKFKSLSTLVMALFFSLTAPVGIAIGIGISTVYKEDSSTALIVEGTFNSASAGILIYMALVDLLAADFMNPRMQSNSRLQLGANFSLLLGVGCMSVLAKWA